jgi:ribosomal protein L17
VANILHVKLIPYVEKIIEKYQGGLRRRRSTVDHIFTVRQILEDRWEQNLFIDFQAGGTQYGERKGGMQRIY